jgi:hypothetical protein
LRRFFLAPCSLFLSSAWMHAVREPNGTVYQAKFNAHCFCIIIMLVLLCTISLQNRVFTWTSDTSAGFKKDPSLLSV